MPRFVVLWHEMPAGSARGTHFDLMLEREGALLTWALDQLPITEISSAAQRLPDHRLAYLDYEGPVSGNRGHVSRVDCGNFDWIEQQPNRFQAQLRGEKLRGTLLIEELDQGAHRWRVSLSD